MLMLLITNLITVRTGVRTEPMKSLPIAFGTAAVLALSACATAPAPSDDGRIQVVASTSVYGDLAATIGGEFVSVSSIIASPALDPHSYEASAQDQLALSRADLVIYNGGGYDAFIELLLDAVGTDPAVVNAVEASGLLPADALDLDDVEDNHDHAADDHDHDHIAGFNEHVWYDLHAVPRIVEEIAHELADLDPEHAATFESNAAALAAAVDALHDRAHELADDFDGERFASTEPVAVYLLAGVGLDDATPPEFAEAIEEGADVPPAALLGILSIIDGGELAVLAYNEQTTSSETERVLAAAESAGLPVVSFAETLPDGEDYVSWMADNLDRLEAALR